jgi:eukaryotic-like serine/threonine-protein kinase
MSTKIGHFEILGELAKSPTGAVYKANDPQSGQTIALKAIQLSAFGENAAALEQALLAEAESTKSLSSPNITPVFGAGAVEGQFCATTEYVQGNSIGTMLARKEGFSIWDLLDIGRQVCAGLDHAHAKGVVHYSLEPSKIMCGWDGTVKILGFGVSSAGKFPQPAADGVPTILYYMSPEQLRGETMDGRSNLFSLGAMFYEMVTDRKAFPGEEAEAVAKNLLESATVPPVQVNPKLHPLLSDLILKALAKNPADRYQNGRELLDDLEKCKESKPAAAKKPETVKASAPPAKTPGAAQAKFAGAPPAQSEAPRPAKPEKKFETPAPAPTGQSLPASKLAAPKSKAVVPAKAAAAAAGVSGNFVVSSASVEPESGSSIPSAYMSSAVADEPQVETFAPDAPKIAVDPMMAEGGQRGGGGGTSFSEMTELPPLKEIYIEQPKPPVPDQPLIETPTMPSIYDGRAKTEEKPKVQPREVAQKAIKEIKSVPPRLMLYAIGGAIGLILIIGVAVVVHIHSLNGDDDSGAARQVAEAPVQPAASLPVATAPPVVAQPANEMSQPEPADAAPVATSKSRNARKRAAPAAAPVIIPGQMAIDSTPQGAQVQVDGRTDASYVTPFALSNLQPGQHSITVSKAGYSTDTRAVEVTSGNRASLVVHLVQLMSTLVVTSDPAGASVYVDGRDMGKLTPAQFSVDKGQHVVLVRKMGYLDETMNGQFSLGQTSNFAPTLRPLGNAEDIKTVGKMNKLFGGHGTSAGQATVSIRTQPKGAQVAINQRILDKNSPLDVALDPGNYIVDITLTGYAPVHKVISVDKGGKVVVDEVLKAQ